MSDLQGRRVPGEEGSGRRRRWIWLVLGLLLLLLLAVLIPFACQALSGDSGAQGGAEQSADGKGADNNADNDARAGEARDGEGGSGSDGNVSGETASGETGEQSGSGGSEEVATARLSARDQSGAGETVTVASVEGTEGWLAVRADENGRPGEVLGRAPLQGGTNENVKVELRRPLDSSQELYTTVHAERPADGDFTYPDGDPTLERDGRVVAQPISYTLAGTTSGTVSGEAANGAEARDGGIRDDELPESGGVPPGLLLAAAAFLLLLSSALGLASVHR